MPNEEEFCDGCHKKIFNLNVDEVKILDNPILISGEKYYCSDCFLDNMNAGKLKEPFSLIEKNAK